MKAILNRAVLASRVRSDCKKLLPALRQHGMVGKQIERWFREAPFGFGGGHCRNANKAERAAWLIKLREAVEWAAPLSEFKNGKRRKSLRGTKVLTFTEFLRSARYAIYEGEPAVLFDLGSTVCAREEAPLYVNVEHEFGGAYSTDAWGSVLDTKSLYLAALFLYVEALEMCCDEYVRYRETSECVTRGLPAV